MTSITLLNRNQLRSLDATASTIGLSTEQLMERAGYEFAKFLSGNIDPSDQVLFICGPGNNGGDGLSACRHLHNLGYHTSALLTGSDHNEHSRRNAKILDHLSLPLHDWNEEFSYSPYDVIIDCLLGYSQTSAPRTPMKEMVVSANASGKRIIACDLPTGLHVDTGEVFEPCIKAEKTFSLVAPKKCFSNPEALKQCGEITIAGIGIPSLAYEQLGLAEGEFLVEGWVKF